MPRTVAGRKGRASFPVSVKTRATRRESRAMALPALSFTVARALALADTAIPADPGRAGRQRKSRSIHLGRPPGDVMADR